MPADEHVVSSSLPILVHNFVSVMNNHDVAMLTFDLLHEHDGPVL